MAFFSQNSIDPILQAVESQWRADDNGQASLLHRQRHRSSLLLLWLLCVNFLVNTSFWFILSSPGKEVPPSTSAATSCPWEDSTPTVEIIIISTPLNNHLTRLFCTLVFKCDILQDSPCRVLTSLTQGAHISVSDKTKGWQILWTPTFGKSWTFYPPFFR